MNLLKYFKSNKRLRKELSLLRGENIVLSKQRENFKRTCHVMLDKSTPELVIEGILNRELKWHDTNSMDKEEYSNYYKEAQAILRSPVFKNECNAFIKDLINEIAMRSKDFKDVRALRYSINGIEVLRERIEKIRNPENREKQLKEPHSAL